MTVEIDIRLAANEFAFGQIFQAMPALRIEFDRIVPIGREDEYLPFVWVEATEAAPNSKAIEEAFTECPDIMEFKLLTAAKEKRLYRLHWQPTDVSLLDGMVQTGGTIVEGYGEHGEWMLRLRFASQEGLSRFNNYCNDHDLNFTLDRMMDVNPPGDSHLDLTSDQLDAIQLAYHHGYYEIPRGISQEGISNLLGVTHQAASERLRRANKKILEQSLGPLLDTELREDE
ncbi:helix-turn-helix domain-containing protein [Haladaptatus sp. CMAA 1911]|uniref:helix-turn-helix domain-containing protein n=1 Tax=unclassified Haladaptatus TaxID=2622732 RepID=UPI003754B07E